MDGGRQLPLWRHDKSTFCEKISKNIAPLKIIIKTRNEPNRLRAWIAHHSRIAGAENLVIFDHMSTEPEVLQIYSEFSEIIPVIQFTGFHNNVHNVRIFPELFSALRQSCRHYCFLDTDEYLTLYDGADRFESGAGIIDFLGRHKEVMVFPGTWLQAREGHTNRFNLHTPIWPLSDGLKWGKPIISSGYNVSGIVLHNTEVKLGIAAAELKTNLFVLHRHVAKPAERISINLLKLKSRGLLKPDDGVEELLALNLDPTTPGYNYVREIRNFMADAKTQSIDGSFEIASDGEAIWSKDWQRSEMQKFLAQPELFSKALFS